MYCRHVGIWLFSVYACLCQVLAEHPCGENPLRRFASLTRILNDLYPGIDINPAMNLLKDSNPELHRRLVPVVSRLESEWRLYTDCVTMVDNGYFKRSGPSGPSENDNDLALRLPSKGRQNLKGQTPWSKDAYINGRLIDILKDASDLNECNIPVPVLHPADFWAWRREVELRNGVLTDVVPGGKNSLYVNLTGIDASPFQLTDYLLPAFDSTS